MHLVCGNCAAINRIPEDKDHKLAICGKCGQKMYTAAPVTLDDDSFFRYVEKNNLPVVVDFWADWCGPCKSMAPVFAKVAGYSPNLLFAKVDTQDAQQIAAQANIRSLPTLVFFHGGKEIDRISGALNESQMKQWIIQTLNKL